MTDDKCEKCGGAIINDHGRPVCINCGESPLPANERSAWYRANLPDMVKDLDELGEAAMVKKWRLRPQYLSHIKGSPEYQVAHPAPPPSPPGKTRRHRRQKGTGKPPAPVPSNVVLPALPVWREDWPTEIKVMWLYAWARARLT